MSSIHSLQLWMDQPLPPFISQPDVTSWECADFKCWPPEHKSHGCHSRAKREELEDTAQVMWAGHIARGYRKGLTPQWDLLTQLQWSHRKHRCSTGVLRQSSHVGVWKLCLQSLSLIGCQRDRGPKSAVRGKFGEAWKITALLGCDLSSSTCHPNPGWGWVALCVGKHQINPCITPWWNSAGKTRLKLFLHCFQAIKDSQTLGGAQNVQVSMSDLQAAWDPLIMLGVRMAIYVALPAAQYIFFSFFSSSWSPYLEHSQSLSPNPAFRILSSHWTWLDVFHAILSPFYWLVFEK